MQSAIILQQTINPLLTHFEANGDLRLNQVAPLNCHYHFRNDYYNYSVVTEENMVNMEKILLEYSTRNCKY